MKPNPIGSTVAPALPPGLRGKPFMCFSLDHDEDEATAAFRKRHGQPPEHVLESLGGLHVGPIPVFDQP